jgi:hypothetical protein
VTLGGIGSRYASLTFKPLAFYPFYKLCNNMVIFLKTASIGRKIQGKGNIMPQLLTMMNPNENRKVCQMKKKLENNITLFMLYPIQFSRGRKLG